MQLGLVLELVQVLELLLDGPDHEHAYLVVLKFDLFDGEMVQAFKLDQ